jgi:predicted membrane protein
MPVQEVLAPLIAGFIFAYLYAQEHAKAGKERDILLEWTWLFCAIGLIVFSFFNDSVVISSTVSGSTTTYLYANPNLLNPYGLSLGVLFIFLIVYFIWRLVHYVKS